MSLILVYTTERQKRKSGLGNKITCDPSGMAEMPQSLTVDAKQKGHEISVFNYISKSMPFITEILLKLGRVNTDIGNITKIAINLVISKS